MPYPPNYGGVIDVFYKLKSLSELGIEIFLHTFEYGRGESNELKKYCKKIYYYNRNQFSKSIISRIPFIVKSRANDYLIENLNKDNYPIIFEGLHTTYPLFKELVKGRKIFVRAHNIEHKYYNGLSKSENRAYKKLFFKSEAKKLASYEQVLNKANYVLTISPFEQEYFRKNFKNKVVYIPVFHQNNDVKELTQKGKFALYHGDLRIADNVKSVLFLIDIFKKINYPFVIASSFLSAKIKNRIKESNHIKFKEIHNQNDVEQLLHNAHINVITTYQKTGIKLKLINTLFMSRFVVTNPEMVEDTGLESLIEVAKTKDEFRKKINDLIKTNYKKENVALRMEKLKSFNTKVNAQKIIDLLY